MWDNERLHAEEDLPLYVAWRRRQESALADEDTPEDASSSSSSVEPKEVLVMADKQDPKYKSLMQQVIAGVQRNDLLQVSCRVLGASYILEKQLFCSITKACQFRHSASSS